MAGFQLTRTIGDVSATYKFTAKYVLKAGQKVTVQILTNPCRFVQLIMNKTLSPDWTLVGEYQPLPSAHP